MFAVSCRAWKKTQPNKTTENSPRGKQSHYSSLFLRIYEKGGRNFIAFSTFLRNPFSVHLFFRFNNNTEKNLVRYFAVNECQKRLLRCSPSCFFSKLIYILATSLPPETPRKNGSKKKNIIQAVFFLFSLHIIFSPSSFFCHFAKRCVECVRNNFAI